MITPPIGQAAETVVEQLMRLQVAMDAVNEELRTMPVFTKRLSYRQIAKLNPADRSAYLRSVSKGARNA